MEKDVKQFERGLESLRDFIKLLYVQFERRLGLFAVINHRLISIRLIEAFRVASVDV